MASAPELDDDKVAPLYHYPVITPCDLCETKDDVNSFCRNCSQNLCDRCKRSHLRCTATRDHNVVHISEGKRSQSEAFACADHGERLFFYCLNCSVLFCPKCLNLSHKTHDILDTDEYALDLETSVYLMIDEKSKKLEDSKQTLQHLEESRTIYMDNFSICKSSIIATAKFLRSEIDRVEAERLSTVNHHKNQGLSKFDEAIKREKSIGDGLQESLDDLIYHSKKHDNYSFVDYASKLVAKNETEQEQPQDVYSFCVQTGEHKASTISKNAISELLRIIHFQDANISWGNDPQSSQLPESQMESKQQKTPKVCPCTKPLVYGIFTITDSEGICLACGKQARKL